MDKYNPGAQNVIRMSAYKPETGYAALSQVEAYWEALRGTRLMPRRSEIDPRGIEQALESAFILERIAPGIARLRIAGTHLNDLMGMEVRGMPLTALFMSPSRRLIADLLEEVFQAPATARLQLLSEGGGGRPELMARMALMPLKSDLGDVSRILGCLVAPGRLGAPPRRFEIINSRVLRLGPPLPESCAKEPTVAPPLPPRGTPAPAPGLAEEARPFSPAPGGESAGDRRARLPAPERPAYLRLVRPDAEEEAD